MSPFLQAVHRLAEAAAGPSPLESLYDELSLVVDALGSSSVNDRDEALRVLGKVIGEAEQPRASLVALGCGAIVEHGGDPNIAFPSVVSRLPDALSAAKAYRDACQAAEAKTAVTHRGEPFPFFFHGSDAGPDDAPDLSLIWDGLDSLARGANAMLSRSVKARKQARGMTELRDLAWELAEDHEQAGYLAELLEVLDDEVLLVLHPELTLGYWVRIRGVADNFQLHTLLADALIGDPFTGWIPGVRPDPRVVAAVRDRAPVGDIRAEAHFNLVGWRGLQSDGSIPAGMDGSDHWIWGEGIPSDIEPFQGTRIVLLGSAPYVRSWRPERRFEGMRAELEVMEKLASDGVRDRLARIAASEH
jgi:hypothetical protein